MADRGRWLLESGAGAAVLFLHGQPGSRLVWEPTITELAGAVRALAPDRPGHGASPLPAGDYSANAEFAAGLLRDVDAAPVVVVAHSWGAGPALVLAARRPELVAGLVLIGPVGAPSSVTALDSVLGAPVLGPALTAAALPVMARVLPWVRERVPGSSSRLSRFAAVQLPDRAGLGGSERTASEIVRSFLIEQRALLEGRTLLAACAREVAVPTVVLSGSRDIVVAPAAAEELAGIVPGAELRSISGVGHFVPRDAPGEVAAAVRGLVGR